MTREYPYKYLSVCTCWTTSNILREPEWPILKFDCVIKRNALNAATHGKRFEGRLEELHLL